MIEENAIAIGDYEQWLEPSYEMRAEELESIITMLNQLSSTLERHAIVIPGWILPGLAKQVHALGSDWTRLTSEILVWTTFSCPISPDIISRMMHSPLTWPYHTT
jgi:hypothetical protein